MCRIGIWNPATCKRVDLCAYLPPRVTEAILREVGYAMVLNTFRHKPVWSEREEQRFEA